MTTIYMEVDGKPVPAKECDWIEVAPCGCIAGVMVVQSSMGEAIRALTAEDARREMAGNQVAEKRSLDEGFEFRLVTHEQFRTMDFADCKHEPKWGVERATLPDDHAWATSDSWMGRKTHIKHMVLKSALIVKGEAYPATGAKALCGKAVSGWWHDDGDLLWDCEPCLKCGAATKAVS